MDVVTRRGSLPISGRPMGRASGVFRLFSAEEFLERPGSVPFGHQVITWLSGALRQAPCVQGRQVCSLQYRHSKIHQCGPEWQRLQVHWIRVLSDLIILNEWAQALATAMFGDAIRPSLSLR